MSTENKRVRARAAGDQKVESMSRDITKVLLTGEQAVGSAPVLTLAKALARVNVQSEFYEEISSSSLLEWISTLRRERIDIVILQSYDGPDTFNVRQLAAAIAVGVPVVRHWAGSDVLNCLERMECRARARSLDRLRPLNITHAGHLREELLGIGIQSDTFQPVIDLPFSEILTSTGEQPPGILVYLPSFRREFYGSGIIEPVIRSTPDLTFVVVADTEHSLASYANVISLGWVTNMEKVWDQVGCVLRMTKHDGIPRMVLDALARGKYVIHSQPLPGCWHATNRKEICRYIEIFRQERTQSNAEGLAHMQEFMSRDGAREILKLLTEKAKGLDVWQRIVAAFVGIAVTLDMKRKRWSYIKADTGKS